MCTFTHSITHIHPPAADAVFFHCDVALSETAPKEVHRDYAAVYLSSMPVCAGNATYLEAQRRAFMSGRSPHGYDHRKGHHSQLATDESDFIGRGAWMMCHCINGVSDTARGTVLHVDAALDDAEQHQMMT